MDRPAESSMCRASITVLHTSFPLAGSLTELRRRPSSWSSLDRLSHFNARAIFGKLHKLHFSNQQTFDCWKMCFGRHHQRQSAGCSNSNVEAETTLLLQKRPIADVVDVVTAVHAKSMKSISAANTNQKQFFGIKIVLFKDKST